jgi:PAS domain S-box-containing protein
MAAPEHWAGKDLAEITASIPALICSYDAGHNCRFVNGQFEEWFGRAPDDFIGMHMREILGDDEYARLTPFLAQVAAGEQVAFDARSRHRDGTMRDLSVRYVPQSDDAGYNGFLAFIFETASHQHRFHSVFDGSPVAYWEIDYALRKSRKVGASARAILQSLRLVDLNRAAELLFQMNRADAIGCGIADLWSASSLPDFQALVDAARAGDERFEVETRLLRRDGTPLDVLLSCVFPQSSDIRSTITLAIIDLTERKARAAAVEALQNELAHASRVAMLGELTASIAHEVNQPLGAIVNNGSAALRWLNRSEPALDEVRQSLELLVGEANRASEIIVRMRALASKGSLERKPLDPGQLLRDVQAIVARQVRSLGSSLAVETPDNMRPLSADRVQMQQVLVNLVVNAAQAMAGQAGRREIRLQAAEAGDGVVFVVEDTGPGIPADKVGIVFNAFYTTRATGMGIGLSVSKTIVEAHGGSITAETRSPHGARFSVRLP